MKPSAIPAPLNSSPPSRRPRFLWFLSYLLLSLCPAHGQLSTTLIDCSPPASAGDFTSRGFYIESYPGETLDTLTVYLSKFSGAVSLSVRIVVTLDAYDGPAVGTFTTASNVLIATTPTPATILCGNAAIPLGRRVCFRFDIPGEFGTLYYQVANTFAFTDCPNIRETADTTPPLSTFRRGGVKLIVTGRPPTPTAPSVATRAASSVTAISATLNSKVYAGYSTTTMRYEYGIDPAGPLTTLSPTTPPTVSGNDPAFPSYSLAGLAAGRTYRFRAIGQNEVSTTNGSFLTFTTAAAAPTVTTLAATIITSTGAVLNGTVLANGASAEVFFRYFAPGGEGLNAVATPSVVTGTVVTPVSATVTGLLPGTTYTFATRASNSVGDAPWGNLTFTTLPDPLVGGVADPLTVPVAGGSVYGSLIQPDGKTILFGDFTSVYGTPQGRMARLLTNGALEGGLGFNPGANADIICAAVLADGKIMIGGNFTTLQPRGTGTIHNYSRLARLLSDGTVDTTFANPGVNAYVLCMAVQANGAVLVGGDFNGAAGFMGATRNRIARLTPAGTLDTGFNPNADAPVYAIAQEADGNVLLGGLFNFLSGQPRVRIGRVNGTAGLPIPGPGTPSGAGNVVYSIALQRDGRAVIGGTFDFVNGVPRNRLARLNTDGTLDTAFNPNVTGGDVFSIALQANQKLVLGGSFTSVGGTARSKVARVDAAGVLDGFNPNVSGGDVRSIALQADGKVQLGGTFTFINGGAAARTAYALVNNETAYQTLEKRSATEVYWARGGSAPEVLSVAFDQAPVIGTVFTPVGNGLLVNPLSGDWRLSGIAPSLPLTGQIRARARTASGYLSGSSGIMESTISYIHALPVVTTVSVTGITGTIALLTGTVNTSTQPAVPAFKLDLTTAYTQPLRIATPSPVTGTVNFTYPVTGLIPGTTYTFRATAENAGGRTDGTDISFTTPANLNVIYNNGLEIPVSAISYAGAGRDVNFTLNYAPVPGTTLMVVNSTGTDPIAGAFANLTQGQTVNLTQGGVTYPFVATYYGGSGNDLVLVWKQNRAMSWGWNNGGQLGLMDRNNQGLPRDVIGTGWLAGKTLVSMAGGINHSLALCTDGALLAWGGNDHGQLGTGDPVTYTAIAPEPVELDEKFPTAIAAGYTHSMMLLNNGQVWCWGEDTYGQLGNAGGFFEASLPVYAKGALSSKTVIGIAAGSYHSLAVCSDGTVAAWGRGQRGQLGNGTLVDTAQPEEVDLSWLPLGQKVIAVAAGENHSMALTDGGTVATWGDNTSGQLGNGAVSAGPVSFPVVIINTPAVAGEKVVSLTGAGVLHSTVRRADGRLLSWGTNSWGQLGNGSLTVSYTPTLASNAWVPAGQTISSAVASAAHVLAIRTDGTLAAWGIQNEGRLGNNVIGTGEQSLPLLVNPSTVDPRERWVSVHGGAMAQHSLAIIASPLEPAAVTGTATTLALSGNLTGTVNAHGTTTAVSFQYGLTTGYGLTITADPATATGNTHAAFNGVVAGLQPRTTYHYRIVANNSSAPPVYGADRTFTTYSTLQMWRYDRFGIFESTGDAANNADPDGDGIGNLLEFAFDLNPLRPNLPGALPQLVISDDTLAYQFNAPALRHDITYAAQWSTTMTPGSWNLLPDTGAGAFHNFKLGITGIPRAFLRLKITELP
jgi:uncharacterized delta-60 repeat protein